MGPELMIFSLLGLPGATMIPPRERADALSIGSHWTSTSETTLVDSDLTGLWVAGTGDLEVHSSPEDLAAGVSTLLKAYAEVLPPVDPAAEARIDRLMAERQAEERRRPLLRRTR